MEQVSNGVHVVSGGYVNSYIVDGDQGVVLIDTGLPNKHGKIVEELRSIGRGVGEIAAILLTHSHYDHTGGVASLKTGSGAPVIASPVDTPAIRGLERPPSPPMIPSWLAWVTSLMPSGTPVDVDFQVDERTVDGLPDDFSVIDTPGHTPGHISFLLDRDGGAMFVGDAAASDKNGLIVRGFPNWPGSTEIDGSIRHLADFDFERAYFGHSNPIASGASAAFTRFSGG